MTKITSLLYIYCIISCHSGNSGVKHSHTLITTHKACDEEIINSNLLSITCNFDESSIVTDDDIIEEIQISIKKLDEDTFLITISPTATVLGLKTIINDEQSVEARLQRLIYRALELKDDFPLSQYRIQNGSTLHLVLRRNIQQNQPGQVRVGMPEDELMVDPYDRKHTYAQSTVRNFIFGACAIFIGFFGVWTYQICQLQNKFGKNNTSINIALRQKTILNSITYIYYHIIAMERANSFILLITIFLSVYTTDAITNCKYLGNLPNGDAQKFVGFWNDTLFIFKGNNIWYSPFVLDVINWDEVQISSSNPLSWSNITVSIPGVAVNFAQHSQQFTQIDNLLYMQWSYSALEMLIFNMSDISFVDINTYNYLLPLTYFDCLTNNKTHIYVMGDYSNELYIYDIDEDKWIQSQSKFDEEIRSRTCAFNLDQSKMFAFGGIDISNQYYDVVYEQRFF